MLLSALPVLSRLRTHRRLTRVAAEPAHATLDDVELLMRAHAVPEHLVWCALDRMRTAELSAAQAWAWAMAHDGTELAVLLGAPAEDDVVRHHLAQLTPLLEDAVLA